MRKITVCHENDNLVCTAQQARSLSPGLYVRLGKAGRDLQTTVSSNYCFQIFSFSFGNYFYTQCRLTSYRVHMGCGKVCMFKPPPTHVTGPTVYLYPTLIYY